MSFSYFYNQTPLADERLKFLWEFDDGSDSSVVVDTSPGAAHSGVMQGDGNFYSVAGKGYFDPSHVEVANYNQIDQNQFTLVVDYERTGGGEEVLASTYTLDAQSTYGWTLGFNRVNGLFLQAQGENGRGEIRHFDLNLARRNIVALRKTERDFTLSYFDPMSERLTHSPAISFPIDITATGNKMYLGGQSGFYSWGAVPFTGYLAGVAYIDRSVGDDTLATLCKGFKEYSSVPTIQASGLESEYSQHHVVDTNPFDVLPEWQALADEVVSIMDEDSGEEVGQGHYEIDFTGSFGATINLTGTLYHLENDSDTVISGKPYGADEPNTGGLTGNMTGVSDYHLDSYGNNTFTHDMRLVVTGPTGLASPEYGNFEEIYRKYGSVEVGSVAVDTGNYHDYRMDGVTMVRNTEDTIVLDCRDGVVPADYNKTPPINYGENALRVPEGTGANVYVNRSLDELRAQDGVLRVLAATIQSGDLHRYDYPTQGSFVIDSAVSSTKYANSPFYLGASEVYNHPGRDRRQALGHDYIEVSSMHGTYAASGIFAGDGATGVLLENVLESEFWEYLQVVP